MLLGPTMRRHSWMFNLKALTWRMVLPTPKTKTMAMLLQVSARAVFSRKDLPSAINMPMELSPSTPGWLRTMFATISVPMVWL